MGLGLARLLLALAGGGVLALDRADKARAALALSAVLLLRSLEDLSVQTGGVYLERAGECHERFTPERWHSFAMDTGAFRDAMAPIDWVRLFYDHGFNATPGWSAMARPLVDGPISRERVTWVKTLDIALMAGVLALLGWAFGAPTMGLAALIVAVGWPWEVGYTVGSMARYPWLITLVGSVALTRKGWPLVGGILLALSCQLRVFPALFVAGPALALFFGGGERRSAARFLGGLGLGLIGGLASSLAVLGPELHQEFIGHIQRHHGNISMNSMGLGIPLAFPLSTGGVWTEGAVATTMGTLSRLLGLGGGLAMLVLMARRAQAWPLWRLLAAGILLPMTLLNMGSYTGSSPCWRRSWPLPPGSTPCSA